jgi:hypothetical protein
MRQPEKPTLGYSYLFVVRAVWPSIYVLQIMENHGEKYRLLVRQRALFGEMLTERSFRVSKGVSPIGGIKNSSEMSVTLRTWLV